MRVTSLALAVSALGCLVAPPTRPAVAETMLTASASIDPPSTSVVASVARPTHHILRDDDHGPVAADAGAYDGSCASRIGPDGSTFGHEGKASASQSGHLGAGGGAMSFVCSGSVDVSRTVPSTNEGRISMDARATAGFSVGVNSDGPVRYSFSGTIEIDSDVPHGDGGGGTIDFVAGAETFHAEAADVTGRRRTASLSGSGVMARGGGVSLTIGASARVRPSTSQPDRNAHVARATFHGSFSVSALDASTADVIRWTKSGGGEYGVDGNWSLAHVPVDDGGEHQETALFDLPGRHTVDFGGPQFLIDRLEVARGEVTLANANLQVDHLEPDFRPSIVVDFGKLILASGQLTSNSAVIGDLHSAGAEIDVVGPGARWDCLGRLRVGGSDGAGGDGVLRVLQGGTLVSAESRVGAGGSQEGFATIDGTGSTWATGNITVGFSSEGRVQVTGGASVASDEIAIGLGGADFGSRIDVLGVDAGGTSSELDGTKLTIGPRFGVVAAADGAVLKLGDVRLDDGLIALRGVEAAHARPTTMMCDQLTLGTGRLDVVEGARAFVVVDAIVGDSTGVASVFVDGKDAASGARSSLTLDGALLLGGFGSAGGAGFLQVSGGAKLECGGEVALGVDDRSVGAALLAGGSTWNVAGGMFVGDGGTGVVVLDSSTLSAVGDVSLGTRGTLQGNGTVITFTSVRCDGFISPGIAQLPAIVPSKRRASPRAKLAPPAGGTLTIEGDLVLGAFGVITAEVAGSDPDRLVVTGDATLSGSLVLQFKNGFAPKTGDHFEVLRVNGLTTGSLSVATRGLAAGAQFDVTTTGGAVTVTATTDAVALPTVSVKASTKKLLEKKPKTKATLTFARKGVATDALTVSFKLGGTAAFATDYYPFPTTVTFPARKRTVKVKVQIVNDPYHESDETIEVTVLPGADSTQSLASAVRIAIVDDD